MAPVTSESGSHVTQKNTCLYCSDSWRTFIDILVFWTVISLDLSTSVYMTCAIWIFPQIFTTEHLTFYFVNINLNFLIRNIVMIEPEKKGLVCQINAEIQMFCETSQLLNYWGENLDLLDHCLLWDIWFKSRSKCLIAPLLNQTQISSQIVTLAVFCYVSMCVLHWDMDFKIKKKLCCQLKMTNR